MHRIITRLAVSALVWVPFLPGSWNLATAGDIIINEIHYEPATETALEEFVELYNSGSRPVNLSGWYFSEGIFYTFPDGTSIEPGAYAVVAENPERLRSAFGLDRVLGPFDGRLSNEGERLLLRNADGGKEAAVDYGVGFPWPLAAAGEGSSLELVHPSQDPDLGGHWRPSSATKALPLERVTLLGMQDMSWRYRKGTSEASEPPSAWREPGFTEDETWLTGQTSIGIGDDDDKTILDDMLNAYTSVYLRHAFTVPAASELPPALKLRLFVDDGAVVWINGKEVARFRVSAGEKKFNDVARTGEARWEELLIPGARGILQPGNNLLAIHAFNVNLSSNDFSIDAEVVVPARSELPPTPTPGAENSVLSTSIGPALRQVEAFPAQPRAGETCRISVKATDPDGITAVELAYQVVLPGQFIPAELPYEPSELMTKALLPRVLNPAFEDPVNWIKMPLKDDGKNGDAVAQDGIWSGLVPAQGNRTLVRYRLTATDASGQSVRAPYLDDGSLNFAYYVLDGIPAFVASKLSVHPDGAGHAYPPSLLESLPVYTLITRANDTARCVAYNSSWQIPKSNEAARDAFNWEGAFVYDGVVYDHIRYRLRQANDRYGGAGKRSWRFRFHKGNYLRVRDQRGELYPTRWRTLNVGKMFDNKGVGNFGLTETLNTLLWNLTGTPAPFMHTFHFRVVDGVDEVGVGVNGQYQGDFWGMATAVEDYDPRFVDAHDLPDGNLYKLKDGVFDGNQLRRNQGRHAITTDADFQNIRSQLRPAKDANWLNTHVNYPRWFPYHAVVEGIRHYDFVPADSHSKNRAWFFEPEEGNQYGRLWTLPWDHDASWGPNWNDGIDYSKNAIFTAPGKPDFRREYRNYLREFRDLVWVEEVINSTIDELASVVTEFSKADRDRWRSGPADSGSQDFGPLETKVADMKKFAFVSWTGPTGPAVPAGGRARHLDNLSNLEGDATQIPVTPIVTYTGVTTFPMDALTFETSAFADPQGDTTFASMKWRLAEVTDARAPAFDPDAPRMYEATPVWESEELTTFDARLTLPVTSVIPGHAYRVRVRMRDATGRNSHWSSPVHFVVGDPLSPIAVQTSLRITEVMFNPAEGGDAEFIELFNTGETTLDLTNVRFTNGIRFDFATSDVTALAPGEYAVVVKNLGLFTARYDTASIQVAGEFDGKLDNEGDELTLVFGSGLEIQRFTYDDSWYPETDGVGYSLVIVDPRAPAAAWDTAEGWKRSRDIHGSPGRADGTEPPPPSDLQIPGDINQDARLNLSDAVTVLGHLFQGTPATLPCGDGTFAHRGNKALADVNGDALLNLTDGIYVLRYLFLSDPEPVLGTRCVRMTGCPNVCVP